MSVLGSSSSLIALGFMQGRGLSEWLFVALLMGLPAYWVWMDLKMMRVPGGRAWVVVAFAGSFFGLIAYVWFRRAFGVHHHS